MTTCVIDRSKWRCGGIGEHAHGTGDTYLLNEEGFMCCLGFRCAVSGATRREMLNIECPGFLDRHRPKSLVRMGNKYEGQEETLFCQNAMDINDRRDLSNVKREELLTRLARKYGETWIFKGEYTTARPEEPIYEALGE